MRNDLFLKSDVAKNLYDAVRDLPIVDYHCHLSPKEILEDREFPDIAQIWLGGDHYKWRVMRACGVPEYYVTGPAGLERLGKMVENISYNTLHYFRFDELI